MESPGIYAVAARGFRPAWSDLRFAIGLGLAYAVAVFAVDAAFDLNYGYFGRATPARPTLVDALGPWPLRVLLMVLLGVVAMTLFQLPWVVMKWRELHHAEVPKRRGSA